MARACRDIKSANIMRPDSSRVKIGDLGVAKVLKGAMTKTQIGTPHYMPPEVRPPHTQLQATEMSDRSAKTCSLCVPSFYYDHRYPGDASSLRAYGLAPYQAS